MIIPQPANLKKQDRDALGLHLHRVYGQIAAVWGQLFERRTNVASRRRAFGTSQPHHPIRGILLSETVRLRLHIPMQWRVTAPDESVIPDVLSCRIHPSLRPEFAVRYDSF